MPSNVASIVCLLGPTASGKTAAALALAEQVDIEIVSVDSALVYREMDIGTAKPSVDERARVPHHLIDMIDPAGAYSAARFRDDATLAIETILARGRVPVLVGGTMLYYKALTEGLDTLPAADPALRAALEDDARRDGWPVLHARLAALDPTTASRLAPNDAQRIQRALEVCLLTGEPMSALLGAARAAREAARATREGARWCFKPLALEPSDRATLHSRIAQRFDAMLAQGLLDEVRALRGRGDLHRDMPSMRCVGYRQAWDHLDGTVDYPTMRAQGIAATRQLCKRQLTWLRSIPTRTVIDCCAPTATAIAVTTAQRLMAES